jgi:hypothetical protein
MRERNIHLIFIFVCLFGLGAWILMSAPWDLPYGADEKFANAPQEALQTMRDLLTMLTSLATALIGGILFFFVKRKELGLLRARVDRILLLTALILSGTSLYFGLALHAGLLEMLSNGVFDPLAPGLSSMLAYEYNFIIAGVFVTIVIVARHLVDNDA